MDLNLRDTEALLIVGDTERNADLYYATRFLAPDPVVFLWTQSTKLLMVGDLEVDRARSQADVDEVVSNATIERELNEQGKEAPGFRETLLALLEKRYLRRLMVPADFPVGSADFLRSSGLDLKVADTPLFPQRQIKQTNEIQAIMQAIEAAEQGMAAAVEAIAKAQVKDSLLFLEGELLTSETVRRIIHRALLDRDCVGQHTIVACGRYACDPHEQGQGPLRTGESIIIDIFPVHSGNRYFGDITRTIVKGPAPSGLRRLYDVVYEAQRLALEQVAAGQDGAKIHRAVQDLFAKAGFETGERDGHMEGFFHGTGHGLGLEIHEAPRISTRTSVLQAGQVVTVEPGLYYPGLGGVRIEDVVVVREGGCDLLTSFPKQLEV